MLFDPDPDPDPGRFHSISKYQICGNNDVINRSNRIIRQYIERIPFNSLEISQESLEHP